MPKYSVSAIKEEYFEVEAGNQQEAYDKAYSYIYQMEHRPHVSSWNYEIEEIEGRRR